jgi:colanic acid/amylovoran biosynthesis protein
LKKIVLSNCWSYYNKGDASILQGTINILNDIIDDEIILTCLSFNVDGFNKHKNKFGHNVEFLYVPSLVPSIRVLEKILYTLYYPKYGCIKELFGMLFIYTELMLFKLLRKRDKELNKILKKIDEADLFVAVGGNYLWSHSGIFLHLVPIIYAINRGKKILLYGHTIGPFKNNFFKRYMKYVLNNVEFIFLREGLSKDYIKHNIKIKHNNYSVICDLAFYLKKVINTNLVKTKNVGLTVRLHLYDEPKLYKRYFVSIIKICKTLIRRGYKIYIIPFSYEYKRENDLVLAEIIYKNVSSINEDDLTIINLQEYSPEEVLRLYTSKNFIFVIGARLHSSIFALMTGTPSINVSYQHFKSYGIYEQMQMNEYVTKMSDVTYEGLLSSVDKLTKDTNISRKKILSVVDRLNKQTYLKSEKIIKKLLY